MKESVNMRIICHNEDCGMYSVYRFWEDGSFERVLEACGHPKRFPTKEKIALQLDPDKTE